ncbi:tetratricopeptide repeat protein [Tumidithrix elongata RA019]|uniref:Tetratricopeptide repeat protein n=1 Tax=Tumidithrix elongata BACA0141 TaxID=2716417 RepID=A0AAW9Q8C6_9CYAN|nr:tetratricopeptide repeat protein [Tumidithrix elongata RA019]
MSNYEFSTIGYKFLWKDNESIASPEAQTAYQSSVALNPDNSRAWREFGISHAKLGQYESAIVSFQQAIGLNPKDAYPHSDLGLTYLVQGKYELAIASFQQAINLNPKNTDYRCSLGIVYRKNAQYELAFECYQKAIELDPKSAFSHNSLGYFYLSQGDLEKAKTEFIEAINLDSKNWTNVMNLGFVSGLQGNQTEAINLWKQGLKLLTGNSQYDRLFRALHEVGVGEIERGTNSLREILEIEKIPLGYLSEVLEDAELMARFPAKLEGIDPVVEMLRQAIVKVQ